MIAKVVLKKSMPVCGKNRKKGDVVFMPDHHARILEFYGKVEYAVSSTLTLPSKKKNVRKN